MTQQKGRRPTQFLFIESNESYGGALFDLFTWHIFVSRWAIAPVVDGLVVLETGAIALRLKDF